MTDVLQEDIDFLEHYGVKGMHWGVRQHKNAQRHLDRLDRIAKGNATLDDLKKARKSGFNLSPTSKAKNQSRAAKDLREGARIQSHISDGDRKVKNILLKAQGIKMNELNFHQPEGTLFTKRQKSSHALRNTVLAMLAINGAIRLAARNIKY